MTTATDRDAISDPATATPARRDALGWIPPSGLEWLEALRDEHERAVVARHSAREATADLERRQAALRAEHDEAVAEAARADLDPPPAPGRLDPEYQRIQLAEAREAQAAAEEGLTGVILTVQRAVGEHRLSEQWEAATEAEEGAPQDSPAVLLRALEAAWSWPPRPEKADPQAEVEAARAEVEAALADVSRLKAEADERLAAYDERRRDARHHGLPEPGEPDMFEGLAERFAATERLRDAHFELEQLERKVA